MGAWAVDAFANDDALDWVEVLEEADSLAPVEEALRAALAASEDYLEAPEACEALAAAEVLARLSGRWGERNSDTEAVDHWVATCGFEPTPELMQLAQAAIDRILGEESELHELWADSDVYQEWLASVRNLRERVVDRS